LAAEADVALATLVAYEKGKVLCRETTVSRLRQSLENAGVVFPNDEPVRMAKRGVMATLKG
jgi:hypothetical protein